MTNIIIATRGSQLALWQANFIADAIRKQHPAVTTELLVLKTKGDIILDVPLAKVGGKGLFVKEIEEALLDGRADLAVHSMKDVPMELPQGLTLGIVPQREIPADMLLSTRYAGLAALPPAAVVGTSSLRRQAQILALRPDLQVRSLRGNVNTRLRKLEEGEFDAVIMAAAGIRRLGLSEPHEEILSVERILPASGQGALGLEYATERSDLAGLLGFMDHAATRLCVTAERAFLAALEGGCQAPIAAHAVLKDADTIRLDGLVAALDGSRIIRADLDGPATLAAELGKELANRLRCQGADDILQDILRHA